MQTQREIELEALDHGRQRRLDGIEANEDAGRATSNPYMQAIYRRFVLPASAIIADDLNFRRAGRLQGHVALLRDVEPDVAAYMSVRTCIAHMMQEADHDEDRVGRQVLSAIGSAVYSEHLLANFEDIRPELYHTLTRDFERKLSRDEAHRMTVFKMQAAKNGVYLPEWGAADREKVGAYLLDVLEKVGMIHIGKNHTSKLGQHRTHITVQLSEEVTSVIDQITEWVADNSPYFLPCVEPPVPWTAYNEGGWHTNEMRRLLPYVVKAPAATRDFVANADLSIELKAINTLQETKWRINTRLLSTVQEVAQHFDMKEILSADAKDRPPKPTFLMKGMKEEDMSSAERFQFKAWKREMSQWHTDTKKRGVRWGRFKTAMDVARKFKDYPALWFVYFADFRGRKYAATTGVSPQGSDLQKALLEFGEGKPLLTKASQDWFKITGANRYGFDKATLEDRVKWVDDRHEQFMAMGTMPLDNTEWMQADKPLQFLAWVMEYAQWKTWGDAFLSRVSCGMDGSCNGLQNFSAMLRDEVGGIATNLMPPASKNDVPNDIYGMVAERTLEALMAMENDEGGLRARWAEHGMNRKITKRSVMTLPYGSTRFSCAEFIEGDYLREGKVPAFQSKEYAKAARFLSKPLWAAIGKVVVKAREAMEWLQKGSTLILKEGEEFISWTTPTGFVVAQGYYETEEHQVRTRLCGKMVLKLRIDKDSPSRNLHKNGIAPNFVHSMDAAHLTLTTNAMRAAGITSFHMVHDDFGAHCADAEAMYGIIRQVFVDLYETHDPLADFHAKYPMLPPPPSKGNLDLRQVIDSPYFFS